MYRSLHDEDKRLRRLIGEKDPGIYVDIGAWHPQLYSNSYHFHKRRWWGINVEPTDYYFALLEKERLYDINLCHAVGSKVEERDFFIVWNTCLSTFNEEYARKAAAECATCVSKKRVSVVTLEWIYDQYLQDYPTVDFLTIDVEGSEKEVLLGNNWNKFRPRFICIEATYPPTYLAWESIILENGYTFVEDDSVNRYYQTRH